MKNEWNSLPHTYLTKDKPWDPSCLDHPIEEGWEERVPDVKDKFKDLPYDRFGNMKLEQEADSDDSGTEATAYPVS